MDPILATVLGKIALALMIGLAAIAALIAGCRLTMRGLGVDRAVDKLLIEGLGFKISTARCSGGVALLIVSMALAVIAAETMPIIEQREGGRQISVESPAPGNPAASRIITRVEGGSTILRSPPPTVRPAVPAAAR